MRKKEGKGAIGKVKNEKKKMSMDASAARPCEGSLNRLLARDVTQLRWWTGSKLVLRICRVEK